MVTVGSNGISSLDALSTSCSDNRGERGGTGVVVFCPICGGEDLATNNQKDIIWKIGVNTNFKDILQPYTGF
jgi:hypothetical protein